MQRTPNDTRYAYPSCSLGRRLAALAVAAFAMPMLAPAALAQSFPERPVRLVVPFPPGGSSDIVARVMAEAASQTLGQPVVVENIPGAGGNIGTQRVAKSAPDGYTLTQCTIGTCSINTSLYANAGYDIQKDFVPVFLVGGVMNVFTVNNDFPAKSLADMVGWARANPGKLTFASSGVGTSNHLTPEWLSTRADIKMVHVPYKGSGPAIIDLIGGQVMMFNDNEPSILPQIKAGKIRALAVTGPKRSVHLPDVPTMEESGYKDFIVEPWFGYLAPKGTPAAVVARLNKAFNDAIAKPQVRQQLEEKGVRVIGGAPEVLAAQIATELPRWAQVIKSNGIKAQ